MCACVCILCDVVLRAGDSSLRVSLTCQHVCVHVRVLRSGAVPEQLRVESEEAASNILEGREGERDLDRLRSIRWGL